MLNISNKYNARIIRIYGAASHGKGLIDSISSFGFKSILTLFRMGFFGAADGLGGREGGQKGPPLPRICHTYPTMMKLGTFLPTLKKIQKIYVSRDTLFEFC